MHATKAETYGNVYIMYSIGDSLTKYVNPNPVLMMRNCVTPCALKCTYWTTLHLKTSRRVHTHTQICERTQNTLHTTGDNEHVFGKYGRACAQTHTWESTMRRNVEKLPLTVLKLLTHTHTHYIPMLTTQHFNHAPGRINADYRLACNLAGCKAYVV